MEAAPEWAVVSVPKVGAPFGQADAGQRTEVGAIKDLGAGALLPEFPCSPPPRPLTMHMAGSICVQFWLGRLFLQRSTTGLGWWAPSSSRQVHGSPSYNWPLQCLPPWPACRAWAESWSP